MPKAKTAVTFAPTWHEIMEAHRECIGSTKSREWSEGVTDPTVEEKQRLVDAVLGDRAANVPNLKALRDALLVKASNGFNLRASFSRFADAVDEMLKAKGVEPEVIPSKPDGFKPELIDAEKAISYVDGAYLAYNYVAPAVDVIKSALISSGLPFDDESIQQLWLALAYHWAAIGEEKPRSEVFSKPANLLLESIVSHANAKGIKLPKPSTFGLLDDLHFHL
jgi:hypothetical protein